MPPLIRKILMMMKACFLFCIFCLSLAGSFAQESESIQSIDLQNDQVIFRFDSQSGKILSIDYKGESIGQSNAEKQSFDFLLGEKWMYGKYPLICKKVRKDNQTVIVSQSFGDWAFDFYYQLDPKDPLLTCWIKIQWNGKEEQRIKGFWWRPIDLSVDPENYFYGPGGWPPVQYKIGDLQENKTVRFGQITPSIIVERKKDLSFLFICDDLYPNADSCQLAATKKQNHLQTTVSYDIHARMKSGNTQEVGRWCFWILDSNGEKALGRIHDWMEKFGHVVPKDRPDWFAGSGLYSFHPGGTIGSNCKDLGGFSNSLPLLDRIRRMNMNALWIMPIEDQSIYCPRDYYQFQAGLGTGDEYKKLVSHAHDLGLYVLQDCVPHGGCNTFLRAIEHPEWLLYDEEGKTLFYWCFDFNYPTWRDYMAKVAQYYVQEYNIDGYRVDAVNGSKISNWNPAIPYGRASFAKRQGGLNMLRSLRDAVKKEKPAQGGILAEASGSVYGAVGDAIYDFRGCYTVYQDLRQLDPENFVNLFRRYMYEEQYAEIKDLLRLRHSESHDSLRTQLWYGIEPARAVVALTTFIYGIPLIYHEQENGNYFVFKKLFGIQNRLPELRKGTPDYLGVEVPPGVFAVRRSLGEKESIALINFNIKPVDFQLKVGNRSTITDMMNDSSLAVNNGSISVHLDAYQFNVFALRDQKMIPPLSTISLTTDGIKEGLTQRNVGSVDQEKKSSDLLILSGNGYQGKIDPKTGLLHSFDLDGKQVLGPADFYLPEGIKEEIQKEQSYSTSHTKEGTVYTFRKKIENSLLELRYIQQKDSLRLETNWTGQDIPNEAILSFPVVDAAIWGVQTAEGFLSDEYRTRPEGGRPGSSSIYWRVQGTPVLYDSMLCPMYPLLGKGSFLSTRTKQGNDCFLSFMDPPGRVQWTSQMGDQKELTALISWNSPEVSSLLPLQWSVIFGKKPVVQTPSQSDYSLIPVAGGWFFENDHYQLRLSRMGSIVSLVDKHGKPGEDLLLKQGEIYTDYGLGKKGTRYSNAHEVEASSRIEKIGDDLRLVFEGRIRGKGRFDLLHPGLSYTTEYLLGKTPSFEMKYGVRSIGSISPSRTFLSFMAKVPTTDSWCLIKEGKEIVREKIRDIKERSKESRNLELSDTIRLFHQEKPILTLSNLQRTLPSNLFIAHQNIFLAICDGKPYSANYEGSCSLVCTVGNVLPPPFSKRLGSSPSAQKETNTIIKNPGFEEIDYPPLISVLNGRQIQATSQRSLGWNIPSAGKIVSLDQAPEGKKVLLLNNTTGEYLLARQQIAKGILPEGSRWKISAWIKGEKIVKGDTDWKTGTLRWAVQRNGQTHYISSKSLQGTFDWQKVEIVIKIKAGDPPGSVEIGLNGATGKIWIDQITFEKL